MNISGNWLTADSAQSVLAALTKDGHRALFVGGCVRNAVLQMPVADVDIATDAPPETVMRLATAAGFRAIPTGMEHGTITVIAGETAYEVTTFRTDIATDGRHATVRFSANILDDAARRDFTMNALYADATGALIDPLGGLPDILARRVRFVGNAHARITEDYLRILRFFRFHAIYGDQDAGFSPDDLAAISDNLAGLETLSRERVGHEMRKLLAAENPAPVLATMAMTGVLNSILTGSDPKYIAPLVHISAGYAPSWMGRLAVLGGLNVQTSLRLSNTENAILTTIKDEIGSTKSPAALAQCHGPQIARDVLFCRAAMLESPLPRDWENAILRGVGAVFPVVAADLMPQLTGPDLGGALNDLRQRWLSSDLALTHTQLLSLISPRHNTLN